MNEKSTKRVKLLVARLLVSMTKISDQTIVGLVMQEMGGSADPAAIRIIIDQARAWLGNETIGEPVMGSGNYGQFPAGVTLTHVDMFGRSVPANSPYSVARAVSKPAHVREHWVRAYDPESQVNRVRCTQCNCYWDEGNPHACICS